MCGRHWACKDLPVRRTLNFHQSITHWFSRHLGIIYVAETLVRCDPQCSSPSPVADARDSPNFIRLPQASHSRGTALGAVGACVRRPSSVLCMGLREKYYHAAARTALPNPCMRPTKRASSLGGYLKYDLFDTLVHGQLPAFPVDLVLTLGLPSSRYPSRGTVRGRAPGIPETSGCEVLHAPHCGPRSPLESGSCTIALSHYARIHPLRPGCRAVHPEEFRELIRL